MKIQLFKTQHYTKSWKQTEPKSALNTCGGLSLYNNKFSQTLSLVLPVNTDPFSLVPAAA